MSLRISGDDLRRLRQAAGMTVRELAKELGMSESYLTQIEKGDRAMPDGFQGRYLRAVLHVSGDRSRRLGEILEAWIEDALVR